MPSSPERESTEWHFAHFELAPARGRLSSSGSEVPLARKSFEILVVLVRNHERLVTREELLSEVWPDTSVSDAAVASAIRDLRRALGDVAREPRFIATARGRGLRFVHPVRRVANEVEPPASAWESAAIHFERALQALELLDSSRAQTLSSAGPRASRERSELTLALARARWSAGASGEARQAFLEAAEVARRTGDAEVLAQAALGFVGRSDVTPGVNREGVLLLEEARIALGDADSALHAEVLARLGTELYYDDDRTKTDQLTRDALAMAERVADPAITAYVATARHFACQRPDIAPQDRIGLAERAIALTQDAAPSDVLAFALQERMFDLFELGQGAAFEEAFDRYENVVEQLAQPFFSWLLALFRGTRALLAGDVDEAENLAHAALAKGTQLGTPNAEGAFAGQLFSVRREQGRLGELLPLLETTADRHRALPVFRAAGAAITAAGGDLEAASAALEDVMAHDLDDFPRDQNWLATIGTLAPAVAAVGGERRIRQVIEMLEDFTGRMIVVGQGAATHGAVSHHLGVLHASLGDDAAARAHLADAVTLHSAIRAPLWEERSLRELEAVRFRAGATKRS